MIIMMKIMKKMMIYMMMKMTMITDDEEYYEDEYNDESEKDSLGDIQVAIHFPQDESSSSTTSTTTTTTTTTTARPTADPYFTHYDPRDEHAAFMQAERPFEERHCAKVSKVNRQTSSN